MISGQSLRLLVYSGVSTALSFLTTFLGIEILGRQVVGDFISYFVVYQLLFVSLLDGAQTYAISSKINVKYRLDTYISVMVIVSYSISFFLPFYWFLSLQYISGSCFALLLGLIIGNLRKKSVVESYFFFVSVVLPSFPLVFMLLTREADSLVKWSVSATNFSLAAAYFMYRFRGASAQLSGSVEFGGLCANVAVVVGNSFSRNLPILFASFFFPTAIVPVVRLVSQISNVQFLITTTMNYKQIHYLLGNGFSFLEFRKIRIGNGLISFFYSFLVFYLVGVSCDIPMFLTVCHIDYSFLFVFLLGNFLTQLTGPVYLGLNYFSLSGFMIRSQLMNTLFFLGLACIAYLFFESLIVSLIMLVLGDVSSRYVQLHRLNKYRSN